MKPVRFRALIAILLLVPAPSIGTLCGMWLFPGPLGQGIYAGCKVWLLIFPLVWHHWVERKDWSWSPLKQGGILSGILLGFAAGAAILAISWFVGRKIVNLDHLRSMADRNGFGTPARYIGLALYLTIVNSLLEEYVWRWFVFRRSEELVPGWPAVVLSAVLFTVHHVVALRLQFGWTITVWASCGVWLSGIVWSGCYLRFRSIWPGYVSHLLADAAIFVVGWWLIFV